MENFEDKLANTVQHAVINALSKGNWLEIGYGNRIKVDTEVLRDIYNQIDMEKVKEVAADRIETHLADKVFNAMATEISNDVKQILSNKELREDLRAIFRARIREAAEATHDGE